jgi:uncharacterized protein with beta-barrel porin domain
MGSVEGNPTAFGDGTQDGLTINVQQTAAVNGTQVGLNLGSGTVQNSGTIQGGFFGVEAGSAVVNNLGTISGGSTGGGSGISADNATITNAASAIISGQAGIDLVSAFGLSSIFNSGTIIGTGGVAILFNRNGLSGNTLTLDTTSKITGAVLGTGSDILQLGGTGTGTFNLSDIGANRQYQGFSIFNKIGTSTWTLTGSATLAGLTSVTGGILQVDGSLTSPVLVGSNAVLTGAGSVGSASSILATTVTSGGVLSPGHSGIGTLIVNGNLSLQPGSLYAFGVTSGAVGLTQVNGTAILAGDAVARFQGSTFKNQYTILSATNGVNGEFQNFTTNSTAITATLAYDDPKSVTLNLKSNLAGGGSGTPGTGTPGTPGTGTPPGNGTGGNGGNSGPIKQTRNEHAVATALDNAFNTNGLGIVGLLPLSETQRAAAFDILSGEGTSATQETAFAAGQQFTSLMMQQGAFWRSGAVADPNGVTYAAPMGYASEQERAAALPAAFKAMPAKVQPFEARWRGWTAGFDNASSLRGEADPGSADQRHRTAGGAAGLDYQLSPNLLLGMAGGGSSSSFSVTDRATSGSLDGAHVGGYGVARWNAWYAAGTLALASFDNKTSPRFSAWGRPRPRRAAFAASS